MEQSKTNFEQVPLELVRKLAKEFPREDEFEDGALKVTAQKEAELAHESWRAVAERVQHEKDPSKMMELVEQLIAKLDEKMN